MTDLTVIYYTGHREDPIFEGRIQQALFSVIGDIPLISVSQKPIDFGKNICVDDVGFSAHNAWRQFQIGAKEAKTRFVCAAESDYLYPEEYFRFRPDRDGIFYAAMPVYVLFAQKGKDRIFSLKPTGDYGAIVVNREHLINRIDQVLYGHGMWRREKEPHRVTPHLFDRSGNRINFYLSTPIVTFKTDNNLHHRSRHDISTNTTELPYWGKSADLVKRYFSK